MLHVLAFAQSGCNVEAQARLALPLMSDSHQPKQAEVECCPEGAVKQTNPTVRLADTHLCSPAVNDATAGSVFIALVFRRISAPQLHGVPALRFTTSLIGTYSRLYAKVLMSSAEPGNCTLSSIDSIGLDAAHSPLVRRLYPACRGHRRAVSTSQAGAPFGEEGTALAIFPIFVIKPQREIQNKPQVTAVSNK